MSDETDIEGAPQGFVAEVTEVRRARPKARTARQVAAIAIGGDDGGRPRARCSSKPRPSRAPRGCCWTFWATSPPTRR